MLDTASYDAKEQIRQAIDIVDLVGSYLPLRREGRMHKALCPWHEDSRPSLQVNQQRQSFKCWVCNIGGDIFSFLMKMENIEFPQALEMLAERAGVQLGRSGPRTTGEDKQQWYKVLTWAEEQFHRYLMTASEAEIARRYFDERGITEENVVRFRLGFSPDSWDWLLKRAQAVNYSAELLEKVGLVVPRNEQSGRTSYGNQFYDRFRGRVLFPIRDAQARVVAFGGRVLPQFAESTPAKYINSPETPLFSKHKLLYGLDSARDVLTKTRTVLVMEGYTDCIIARQFGIGNSVAVLGTALGEQHLKLLRQYVDRVVLVLDGDAAGQKRVNEILELFISEPIDLRVLTLPDELDPCDFLIERGADAFRQLEREAVDGFQHALKQYTAGVDLRHDVHGASRAVERLLTVLAKAPGIREFHQTNELRINAILSQVSKCFDVTDVVLRKRLLELRSTQSRKQNSDNSESDEQKPESEDADNSWQSTQHWDKREREVLELILLEPECVAAVAEELAPSDLPHQPAQKLYELCLRLTVQGRTPNFKLLMANLTDERLKNLLVELDERAQHRQTVQDPAAELRNFLSRRERERMEIQQRDLHSKLQQDSGNDDLACLELLMEQERLKRGIVPTALKQETAIENNTQ